MVYIWPIFAQSIRAQDCVLCAAPGDTGHAICAACARELPRNDPSCACCALPLPAGSPPDSRCGHCLQQPPAFDRIRAPFLYQPPFDDLISELKYHAHLAHTELLGGLLAAQLADAPRPDALLAVPLHRSGFRQRGFNQAHEVARVLARALQLPLLYDGLHRVRGGRHQQRSNRQQRQRNVRGAFACTGQILPSRIAVIDDVVTTGATANEIARILKRAGVEWVEIWAIARTPSEGTKNR